ncbi:LLM class flavin-dependent oxidoreductase [Amycolatopsis sp. FDAARGOS 1241]|uniref:LLM class flavin-dependent oxidoreductase n=1 Tax=Amycolatopsis sp. FDAARGOS 1241 TaxID=2778070 RepID=UPI001EF18A65|nr:LLM class flavin-dependent oxidoreductase [Amycolatopsis sp. FDAARGOS 1241]
MSTVRHGLYLPPFGPFGDPAVLVDLAGRAQAAGRDGVFLWDHVAAGVPPIAAPWTALGAIAQATRTIRLGPMVTPPARRRPWVLARQASTVSRLSGGRLVVGTGLGSDESGDFSRRGEPLAERSARFDEALGRVRAIWTGEPVRRRGAHFRADLDGSAPEPRPIPIWDGAVRRAPAGPRPRRRRRRRRPPRWAAPLRRRTSRRWSPRCSRRTGRSTSQWRTTRARRGTSPRTSISPRSPKRA